MKKIICFALILLASVCTYAQERTLTKERFDITFKRGFARTAGKSYRVTRTSEFSIEGKPQASSTIKDVVEIVPPNMIHSVTEINSQSGMKRKEMISIAGKTYSREADGEWKEGLNYTAKDDEKWNEASGKNSPKTTANTLTTIADDKEYKLFGYEMWNNQRVAVAGYVRNTKTVNSTNNMETVFTTVYKCWFDENDGLLKTETFTTNKTGEVVSYNRRTEVYDLDPNIKIEAPIK